VSYLGYFSLFVFLFYFSSSWIPYVASFSDLSIFDRPSVFSNVYLKYISYGFDRWYAYLFSIYDYK